MCLYDVHTDKIVKLKAQVRELAERLAKQEAENHKLKLTMQLHAGDCCSLNNEVELFRGHWEDAERSCKLAEERCKELEAATEQLLAEVRYPINSGGKVNYYYTYCYSCGTNVKDQKYCHGCGRKLKWQTLKG